MQDGMKQVVHMAGQETAPSPLRRGTNQSGMRAYNERLVLSLIRQNGAMAKAELARRTGLSAQTVSVIIRALESDGLLKRGEPVRGRIGQPSVPMGLASDGAFFFGLKVGRRSLDLILTDFLGKVLHRVRRNHPFPTPDDTVAFTRDAIAQILGILPQKYHARIAGLGIALPFQLWEWGDTLGVEHAGLRDWQDREISVDIAREWDFPVFVCNDASTACGAELVFGDQAKPDSFLYFFVGFFIGGGLVLDGTVYTGRTGNAAALGSMRVNTAEGHLRQLVDVASLATLEHALAERGAASAMNWDTPATWNIPQDTAESWSKTAAHGIAQAILDAVCLIDVEHVLIDGWMPTDMRAALVRHVQKEVATLPLAGVAKPEILEGTIGSDARALGAASLPLSERFLVERDSYQKGPAP